MPAVYFVLHLARTLHLGRLDQGPTGLPLGPNRVPSGDFEDPDAMTADGWVDVSYQMGGLNARHDDRLTQRGQREGAREE